MADSSLTHEILRNLIQDQELPPEDFLLKTISYKILNFIFDLFEENNTPNKYILTVLSHILKKPEEEISKIVKQPNNFINKTKRYINLVLCCQYITMLLLWIFIRHGVKVEPGPRDPEPRDPLKV